MIAPVLPAEAATAIATAAPSSWTGAVLARLQDTAATGAASLDPLPVGPVLSGPLWSLVVPALLFITALVATALLYLRFAKEGE